MPVYEYRCLQCGGVFEKLVRSASAEQEITCPQCGRREIKRLVSMCSKSGASGDGGRGTYTSCAPTGG